VIIGTHPLKLTNISDICGIFFEKCIRRKGIGSQRKKTVKGSY
jgi:hypothetical protein